MKQKAIITDYDDGTRVISNIRNKKGIPFFRENDTYTATRVSTWYDGTPMDDSKVDGSVYLKHRESNEYYLANLPNWGGTFLQKPNVDALRNMSSTEILLLKMGYYKGVSLLGYYAEEGGDTPAPIQYYLSDTTEVDDGGAVFEVGGIKLEHEFVGEVDLSYFGVDNSLNDASIIINKVINKLSLSGGGSIVNNKDIFVVSKNESRFNGGIEIKSNISFYNYATITLRPPTFCYIPLIYSVVITTKKR